jgi:hypothetical protein
MVDATFEFDVFLSHNSKDKPAVEHLARLLRDEYKIKTWLDKWNLVPGASWQQAIDAALEKCQTFVVFVGPSGIGSWESPEMQVALDVIAKDPTRRVIPVLLPDAPDNANLKLPAFLRLLTWVDFREGLDNKNALYLLYCGIKGIAPGDVTGVVPPSSRPARKASSLVKNFLPYLADCNNQEYYLQDFVRNDTWQSPVVVIVHGDEYQCLEKFRERLERVSLPRVMQLNEEQDRIQSYPVSWPTSMNDIKEFPQRLLKSLSDSVMRQGVGSKDDIQHELAQHPVPVLIHATMSSSEWKKYGSALLDHYLKFWQQWPPLAPRQRLLAFLFIKYQSVHSKKSLFSKPLNEQIMAQISAFDFSLYAPLRGIVLPCLNGVSQAEAEDWARSDAVQAFCDSELVIREIREWYAKEARDDRQQTVPMEKLVDTLKRYLDLYTASQESA